MVEAVYSSVDLAAILGTWASLSVASPPSFIEWCYLQRIVDAALLDASNAQRQLGELMSTSNASLSPLCDPLHSDLGLHRWLSDAREEAYSDWLAWVLGQLPNRNLLSLLGLDEHADAAYCRETRKLRIEREVDIRTGRLDLLISFDNAAVLVVEVKVTSAVRAETAKQERYSEWLKHHPSAVKLPSILIVVDAAGDDYEGFTPVRWADVCMRLRRMLPTLMSELRLTKCAMICAFVGAVESNLLHLAASENPPGGSLLVLRTVEHLRQTLQGKEIPVQGDASSALIKEGAKSYPQALAALSEFRDQLLSVTMEVVSERLIEISNSLGIRELARNELRERVKPFDSCPDGRAAIGVTIRPKTESWKQYYHFKWEPNRFYFSASIKYPDPGQGLQIGRKFKSLDLGLDSRYETGFEPDGEVWILTNLDPENITGLSELLREVVNEWCKAWKKLGGIGV